MMSPGIALVWALACGAGGLLLTGLLAFVVVRFSRPSVGPDGARSVLDRRLATGDIDVEEYYEREAALRNAAPPARRRR